MTQRFLSLSCTHDSIYSSRMNRIWWKKRNSPVTRTALIRNLDLVISCAERRRKKKQRADELVQKEVVNRTAKSSRGISFVSRTFPRFVLECSSGSSSSLEDIYSDTYELGVCLWLGLRCICVCVCARAEMCRYTYSFDGYPVSIRRTTSERRSLTLKSTGFSRFEKCALLPRISCFVCPNAWLIVFSTIAYSIL